MTDRAGSVIPPNGQRKLLEGPLGALLLLPATETDGRLTVVEHPLAPRALGAPVHTHRHEDEYSIVIEGTIGVEIGDKVFEAGPGCVVVKPRGIPHAFWNPTDHPARLLEIISPAGFEGYFGELATILGVGGPPDLAALVALAARYGLDLDPASIPRLVAAHELNLGERPPRHDG
jgi:mannose-6-phosphate isomerase-like protein (cupin superfamily)